VVEVVKAQVETYPLFQRTRTPLVQLLSTRDIQTACPGLLRFRRVLLSLEMLDQFLFLLGQERQSRQVL
jgi:hypothetical protein